MSEWDQRQLCPDGGCVGVIGDNGKCTVCGRAAPEGAVMSAARPSSAEDPDGDADDDDDDDDDDEDGDDDGGADGDDDDDDDDDEADEGDDDNDVINASASGAAPASKGGWDDRALCPDGGCVGLIGDNGKCKVCGRSAA